MSYGCYWDRVFMSHNLIGHQVLRIIPLNKIIMHG